jgi:hypothetical protein
MRGDFGSDGDHVWLSPLSSIYWFLVAAIVEAVRKSIPVNLRCVIPP